MRFSRIDRHSKRDISSKKITVKITKNQYEFALARIEKLLPLVNDDTPSNNGDAIELSVWSDIVMAYEKEHYPIEKPTDEN